MKKIKLNSRKKIKMFALISDEDFDLVSEYKWHLDNHGYARTELKRGKFMSMHRLVNDTKEGKITDHINQNKLDNRKCNLRTVSQSLNTRNAPIRTDNTSGYKGIDFYKRVKKWRVRISGKGLGYFDDLKDAITTRKLAEMEAGWTN